MRASAAGYTVVDPTTALSTHLSETIRTFLPDLLSRQQTKEMVDQRGADVAASWSRSWCRRSSSIGDIQRVLRQLLRERVPVRDLDDDPRGDGRCGAGRPRTPTRSPRRCARRIGRAICRPYQTDKGELPAISVAPALEERLLASIVRTEQGAVLALDPTEAQSMATRIARALEQAVAQPVLLCTPALRPHLWRLFARVLPHIGVLSHSEVPAHVRIAPVAVLD